jgi:drug/metabolite transporter (DMT)-like permease
MIVGVFGRYLLMWFGIASASSAVLFIKGSNFPPITLAWMRLLVAAAALAPMLLIATRRSGYRVSLADFRAALPGAVLLALHFVFWIVGVRKTTAANASLIVNFLPIAMPFAMYLAERQRLGRGELVGTVIALAGVGVLTAGSVSLGGDAPVGDALCALAMLLAVAYMTFGRIRGRGRPLLAYLVPLYAMATPVAMVFSVRDIPNYPPITLHEVLMVLGLGLIPTVIGHSISNWSMVHLRSQVVAISNLGQFIFASVLAVLIFNEWPAASFYPAAALIVLGAVVVVRSAPPPVTRAIEAAQAQAD